MIPTRHNGILLFILFAVCISPVSAQSGVQVVPSAVAGGGGKSAGSAFQIEGTVGQSITSEFGGDTFQITSGFWAGASAQVLTQLSVDDQTATYSGSVNLTATLSAAGANVSGKSVQFSLNCTNVGTAVTDNTGRATLNNVSLTGIDAGTYISGITAEYAGDAEISTGKGAGKLSIDKAEPVLSVSGGGYTFDGQPHSATANATGINQEILSPITILYNGTTNIPVNVGAYTVSVTFAGNQNYNAVENHLQSIIIGKAGQTITFGTLADRTFGDAPFALSASASSNMPVSFQIVSGPAAVSNNILTITGAGSVLVRAQQPGNSSYNSAPEVTRSFTVAKAATSVTITSSRNPAESGQSISLTGVVASAAGAPSGSLQFKFGGSNVGAPVTLAANGSAVLVTNALPAANHVLTADYSGDANFAASVGTLPGSQVVLALPEFSISDVSIAEGDSGTTDAVFTVTLSAASSQPISVSYATADYSATSAVDYEPAGGTLLFAPGEISKSITIKVKGDQLFEPNETFAIKLSGATNAGIADPEGAGTILNDDSEGGIIRFSSAEYQVAEGGRMITLSVERTGDITRAATVDYATPEAGNSSQIVSCSDSNGTASSRCDFTSTAGTLSFAPGETSKTITILITQDSYTEGPETFQVPLTNPTGGAVLSSPSTAVVTITDDPVEPQKNSTDETEEFIHQQYHDFLGREPDAPGLAFWTDNINKCHNPARRPADQTEAQCMGRQRETTSAAFFVSNEFQTTGSYVVRLYEGSLGRLPTYAEFIGDLGIMTNGIIMGERLSGTRINANGQVLASEFTGRPEFRAAYDSFSDEAYVSRLFEMTGTPPTLDETQALVQSLNGGTETRASVLRKVIDGAVVNDAGVLEFQTRYGKAFYDKVYNRTFVLMEYFGYLRRDPDVEGYRFWVEKINRFGNYLDSEMVRSFLISAEFRKRFWQQ